MRKDFYIFRHGETEFNLQHRQQGSGIDMELTAKGQEQAIALAQKLARCNLDVIFSSPLKRAVQTAQTVAKAWKDAMDSNSVKDFVAVGDVSVKVIGADNAVLDSEIPVKQLLEQIVAKTGLPPFMLGLSWSSTERMSVQQADILTSELESYRRILEPVIKQIGNMYLALNSLNYEANVEWKKITLQDECELAQAQLYTAQAEQIRKEIES